MAMHGDNLDSALAEIGLMSETDTFTQVHYTDTKGYIWRLTIKEGVPGHEVAIIGQDGKSVEIKGEIFHLTTTDPDEPFNWVVEKQNCSSLILGNVSYIVRKGVTKNHIKF
jgi:hypothetical protein